MDRFAEYLPMAALVAGALIIGHLGLTLLPADLDGFSTPLLLTLAVGGSIAAGLRWL